MSSSTKLNNWNISTVAGDTPTDIVTAKQVHGNTLVPVSICDTRNTVADGLVGNQNDRPFGLRTADCMPLVLITQAQAYGLHISRKTLIEGILEETIQHLGDEKIEKAYIGPHICKNCFTFSYVGEGIKKFEELFPYATETRNEIIHLSLLQVVMPFLEKHGVPKEHINQDTRCTFETPELPSYRRHLAQGSSGKLPEITTVIRYQ